VSSLNALKVARARSGRGLQFGVGLVGELGQRRPALGRVGRQMGQCGLEFAAPLAQHCAAHGGVVGPHRVRRVDGRRPQQRPDDVARDRDREDREQAEQQEGGGHGGR